MQPKAGRLAGALTLQQFKADSYFELSLYGLQGEKCEQKLRFSSINCGRVRGK